MSARPVDQRQEETGRRHIFSDVYSTNALSLQIFEFTSLSQTHSRPSAPTNLAALLHRLDSYPSQLRIICAPYQVQHAEGNAELESLMDHYSVPATVRTERAQSVTHSFGTQTVNDGSVDLAWNHFLSRIISTRVDEHARTSVANSSWIMSDYIVHVRRSQQSGGQDRFVTVLCFGAPPAVIQRFRQLQSSGNWHDIHTQPFLVFDLIYVELFLLVDKVAWALADVFWPIEKSTLELAELGRKGTFPEMLNSRMDFAGLHDMSKHCIYVLEGLEAATLTLNAMITHLQSLAVSNLNAAIINNLDYRKRTFESTLLRVRSLEKRMGNISSLSFHLVTQHDSEIMRDDSKVMRMDSSIMREDSSVMREDSRVLRNDSAAMKMVALLTLVFLPATGVASVLSCPFFTVDFKHEAEPILVASSFKVFWIVVLPLTFGIVLVWALYCTARQYGWPSFGRRPQSGGNRA